MDVSDTTEKAQGKNLYEVNSENKTKKIFDQLNLPKVTEQSNW